MCINFLLFSNGGKIPVSCSFFWRKWRAEATYKPHKDYPTRSIIELISSASFAITVVFVHGVLCLCKSSKSISIYNMTLEPVLVYKCQVHTSVLTSCCNTHKSFYVAVSVCLSGSVKSTTDGSRCAYAQQYSSKFPLYFYFVASRASLPHPRVQQNCTAVVLAFWTSFYCWKGNSLLL